MALTQVSPALLNDEAQAQGFRNRIINGDMRIAQRGTSFTGLTNGSSSYTLDQWSFSEIGVLSGVCTITQETNAPNGFVSSLKFETTTAANNPLDAGEGVRVEHRIEGTNCADLGFGTANAKTVTVSFWVRSSLTGTFGGALQNTGSQRSYPFTYAISAADTWEYKTITIPGDTTGTWATDTSIGIRLRFSLGAGSTYSGTAGEWAGSNYQSATGAVSVINTLNATWYITGVQLEVGSVATAFERRPYGTELALCQRYYYKIQAPAADCYFQPGFNNSTTVHRGLSTFPVTMRVPPTSMENSGDAGDYSVHQPGSVYVTLNVVPSSFTPTTTNARVAVSVASGLTSGDPSMIAANNADAFLAWSAEL